MGGTAPAAAWHVEGFEEDVYGVDSTRSFYRREESKWMAWIGLALLVAIIANVSVGGARGTHAAGNQRRGRAVAVGADAPRKKPLGIPEASACTHLCPVQ
jgi:hypothetical protein